MSLWDLFKKEPVKTVKTQRPPVTSSKEPVNRIKEQSSKPNSEKKIQLKVSNHAEIEKSLQLSNFLLYVMN